MPVCRGRLGDRVELALHQAGVVERRAAARVRRGRGSPRRSGWRTRAACRSRHRGSGRRRSGRGRPGRPVEGLEHLAVDRRPARRRVGSSLRFRKRQLGAEQPHALDGGLDGRPGGLAVGDVGQEPDRLAVGRLPRPGPRLQGGPLLASVATRRSAVGLVAGRPRSTPAVPSTSSRLPRRDVERAGGADHARDAELAGDDRGVAGRAARARSPAPAPASGSSPAVSAGARSAATSTHGCVGHRYAGLGLADDPGHHPALDVEQVGDPLGHQPAHAGEDRHERLDRRLQRRSAGRRRDFSCLSTADRSPLSRASPALAVSTSAAAPEARCGLGGEPLGDRPRRPRRSARGRPPRRARSRRTRRSLPGRPRSGRAGPGRGRCRARPACRSGCLPGDGWSSWPWSQVTPAPPLTVNTFGRKTTYTKTAGGGGDMYAEERQQAMAQLIGQQGRLSVAQLAGTFDVTTETVRRDLSSLERIGLVRRVHGGAVPSSSLSVIESGARRARPGQHRRQGRDRRRRPRPAPPARVGHHHRRRLDHRPARRRAPPRAPALRRDPRGAGRRAARGAPPHRAAPAARPGPPDHARGGRHRHRRRARRAARRRRVRRDQRASAPTSGSRPPTATRPPPSARSWAAPAVPSCWPTPPRSASRPRCGSPRSSEVDVLVTDSGIAAPAPHRPRVRQAWRSSSHDRHPHRQPQPRPYGHALGAAAATAPCSVPSPCSRRPAARASTSPARRSRPASRPWP